MKSGAEASGSAACRSPANSSRTSGRSYSPFMPLDRQAIPAMFRLRPISTVSMFARTKTAWSRALLPDSTDALISLAIHSASLANATVAATALTAISQAIIDVSNALASLGSGAKRIDIQADFTGKLMDILKQGVGNLVDADLAQESANLQALQIKQTIMASHRTGEPGVLGFLVTCVRYQPIHENRFMKVFAALDERVRDPQAELIGHPRGTTDEDDRPQDAVEPELDHHPGHQGRDVRWRGRVSLGKPDVERHDARLHAEPDEGDQAAPAIADIHHRMPVILTEGAHEAWLSPTSRPSELGGLFTPFGGAIHAYAVSDRVNAPRNDDPGLLDPAPAGFMAPQPEAQGRLL